MSAFNYFDIYCINLPEDDERRKHMEKQFKLLEPKFPINWISAARPHSSFKTTNYQFSGEFGVTLSQLKALVHSMGKHVAPMIFEDDVVFCDDAHDRISQFINNLPSDWAIAYLGGCPKEKLVRVNEYVCKVGNFTQAASWLVNIDHINSLINFILDRMSLPFPNACFDNMINDYIRVANNPGYCAYPPIIEQKDGWSTLRQGDRNYKTMIRGEWEKFKP